VTSQRVTIRQTGIHSAEIMVNGVDLASLVSAYHIHADQGDGPQVVLQFSAAVLPEFDSPAELLVTEDLAEALLHLGWRPPPAPDVTEREVTTLGEAERVFIRSDGTYRTEPWHVPEPETKSAGQPGDWATVRAPEWGRS
jgi:hypothetical protein